MQSKESDLLTRVEAFVVVVVVVRSIDVPSTSAVSVVASSVAATASTAVELASSATRVEVSCSSESLTVQLPLSFPVRFFLLTGGLLKRLARNLVEERLVLVVESVQNLDLVANLAFFNLLFLLRISGSLLSFALILVFKGGFLRK